MATRSPGHHGLFPGGLPQTPDRPLTLPLAQGHHPLRAARGTLEMSHPPAESPGWLLVALGVKPEAHPAALSWCSPHSPVAGPSLTRLMKAQNVGVMSILLPEFMS